MAFVDGGKDLPKGDTEDKNGNIDRVFRTSFKKLQNVLENREEKDMFVRNFTLFVVRMLLMPTTSLNIIRSIE